MPEPVMTKAVSFERGGVWTPRHVVWGIVALLVLLFVETIFVAPFDPDLDSLAATLIVQLLLAATMLGVAFGFATLPGSGFAPPSWLGLRRVKFTLAWESVVVAVVIYFVFAAVYGVFVHPDQEDVARELGSGSGTFGTIASAILIVGAAPFSEEVFFRGFVFGGLRHRFSFWPAAAVAGVLFGLVHFTGIDSVGVLPQLAVLGVLLCWVYERTGSIWPTIGFHALNNLLAFVFIAG
jgi:hypothetical protein